LLLAHLFAKIPGQETAKLPFAVFESRCYGPPGTCPTTQKKKTSR